MKVEFDGSFSKSLEKIKSQTISRKVENIIIGIEEAVSIEKIKNIKKLKGIKNYYRIRFRDYRIGIEVVNDKTGS